MTEVPDEFRTDPFPADTVYELRISGRLGDSTSGWFEDLDVTIDESTSPVQTIIRGPMRDQSALYGVIGRVRDLGITLLSVNRITEEEDQ